MIVVVMVWLVCYMLIYREYAQGQDEPSLALDVYRVVQMAVVVMKFLFVMLMLFMFIQFSNPHTFNQFDKVCKKKFLDYLDEIHNESEEAQNAVKLNLSRYLLRLEAQSRKEIKETKVQINMLETAGTSDSAELLRSHSTNRTSGKIVDDTLIIIFMSFLMYAPVGRRDFLQTNMTIEEDFQGEAANHELLAEISKSYATTSQGSLNKNFKSEIIPAHERIRSSKIEEN